MPRPSTLLNVVLVAVVLAQAWMLHRRDTDRNPSELADARSAAATGRAPSADARAADLLAADPLAAIVIDRLQRIDARLAALEAGAHGATEAPTRTASSDRIDPRTIAAADRRLFALLPDTDLDRDDWARWQATLASLPANEQFALSVAFSRAMNNDRIRIRF